MEKDAGQESFSAEYSVAPSYVTEKMGGLGGLLKDGVMEWWGDATVVDMVSVFHVFHSFLCSLCSLLFFCFFCSLQLAGAGKAGKGRGMIRATWMWIAVSLVAVSGGCRMCAHCYDNAGPVFGGDCPSGCGYDARAGSILSGGVPMVEGSIEPAAQAPSGPSTELQPVPTIQPQPAPTTEPQLPPYVPPTTQSSSNGGLHPEFGVDPRMIISITDRKVGEDQQTTPQGAADAVK